MDNVQARSPGYRRQDRAFVGQNRLVPGTLLVAVSTLEPVAWTVCLGSEIKSLFSMQCDLAHDPGPGVQYIDILIRGGGQRRPCRLHRGISCALVKAWVRISFRHCPRTGEPEVAGHNARLGCPWSVQ